MKRIGILGDIGSGKSYVARNFGYPVFNADEQVSILYRRSRKTFVKLKKILPKHIKLFPINKLEISKAILDNKVNLKKIIKIVHIEIKKKMFSFLKKNKNKEIVILDIPLLLENKINKKGDILIFVQSPRKLVIEKLKKRKNFNSKLVNKFKNVQLPLDYKKRKSQFIIKNDFKEKAVKKEINKILQKIL